MASKQVNDPEKGDGKNSLALLHHLSHDNRVGCLARFGGTLRLNQYVRDPSASAHASVDAKGKRIHYNRILYKVQESPGRIKLPECTCGASKELVPFYITVPTGNTMLVEKVGNVSIDKNIKLNNVLLTKPRGRPLDHVINMQDGVCVYKGITQGTPYVASHKDNTTH
ncbi:hypothetical protein CR513_26555, partial [Mucuna pruriens]